MQRSIQVLIWNEYLREREEEPIRAIYPDGIHRAIADGLSTESRFKLRTATLDEPEHGLTEEIVRATDVMVWWGHRAHENVDVSVVDRIHNAVLQGMGLIVLHSGHDSRIFKRLMGTSCSLKWRVNGDSGERERLWIVEPSHPICDGIGSCITLPASEMYGERFDVPQPAENVFISWFEGGEVFRSGCTWRRGHGKIFYFSPGHESYPIYHNPDIIRVIRNAVFWAMPSVKLGLTCERVEPLEPLDR